MRDIFTYPNNFDTYYIDPNYLGDDTTGFQGRIKDMIDDAIGGDYEWFGAAPDEGLSRTITELGKYYNYYDTVGEPNITVYDFSRETLVDFKLAEKSLSVTGIVHSPGQPLALTVSELSGTWGLRDGRDFFWENGNAGLDITNVSAFQREWYGIADPTQRTANSDTTDSQVAFDATKNTYWQAHDALYGTNPAFIKYGPDGSLVKTQANMTGMPTISRGFKKQDFTEAHDTGTLNTGQILYFKDQFNSSYSRTCWTDAACTIPASLDENYYTNTAVFTITAAAGTTTNFDFSNKSLEGVLTPAELQTLDNGPNEVYGRIYWQNLTGTDASIVPKVNSPQNIADSLANSYYDNTYNTFSGVAGTDFSVGVKDTRGGGGVPMDGQLVAGATDAASVEIHVEFINAARMQDLDAMWTVYDGTETVNGKVVRTNHYDTINSLPYWGVDVSNSFVIIPGNKRYRYRDSGNNLVNGSEFSNDLWFPGASSATSFSGWSNIVNAPSLNIELDANGRSTGNLTYSGLGNFTADEPGGFMLRVQSLPDEYVPPAPTPVQIAAAEDNFDTNNQWDNFTGYSGGAKRWPLIPPKSARIDYKTPTLTTTSQSGIKYARHAGYTRYGLDVTYPPLTKDQMALLQSHSELARGGAVTFTFDINPLNTGNDTAFGFKRYNNGANTLPVIKAINTSENTYLVEGLGSNLSNAVVEGQLVGSPSGGRNGGVFLALNTVDANIYGETKIKFGFLDNSYTNSPVGTKLWLYTDILIVSLSSDNFQYVERGDGLYDCSIRFDLDFWK